MCHSLSKGALRIKGREVTGIPLTAEVRAWHDARREAHIALVRQAWKACHPGRPYPEDEHCLTQRYLAYLARWHRAYARQLLASRRRAR